MSRWNRSVLCRSSARSKTTCSDSQEGVGKVDGVVPAWSVTTEEGTDVADPSSRAFGVQARTTATPVVLLPGSNFTFAPSTSRPNVLTSLSTVRHSLAFWLLASWWA